MAHTMRTASIAALLSAAAILPSTAMADHQYQQEQLLQSARRLHVSIQQFERIASHRPLARHEIEYVRVMVQKACRLVEGLECLSPWGRVEADYHVLKGFVRTVDRRIRRACGIVPDRPLLASWHRVQDDLYAFGCLVEAREIGVGYGRRFPGPRDQFNWGPQRRGPQFGGRFGGGPLDHQLNRRDGAIPGGRFEEVRPGEHYGSHLDGRQPGGEFRIDEVRPSQIPLRRGGFDQRSARNVAPWLQILSAVLSR